MKACYDATADAKLQRLYEITTPGPQYVKGKFLPYVYNKNEVTLFMQACGIAYERDQITLIPDTTYDIICFWLGDNTATAMNWQSYPNEVKTLANQLIEAKKWREQAIVCFHCWHWAPKLCTCSS